MKTKIILLLALTASFYSGCTYNAYNPDICFQENILPIFVTKCSMQGCHNSNGNSGHRELSDLTTYDGIMKGITPYHPLLSKNYTVISGLFASMPKGQKLDQKDISYIDIWIKMGAPNTSNCVSCDSSNFSYSSRVKPLMSNWCVGCHNTGNAGGGYDLSNYSGVANSIVKSRLLGTLKHLAGFSPMPKNTNPLSDCDINAVVKWINAGYPNN